MKLLLHNSPRSEKNLYTIIIQTTIFNLKMKSAAMGWDVLDEKLEKDGPDGNSSPHTAAQSPMLMEIHFLLL
jgi:hypothetical protein